MHFITQAGLLRAIHSDVDVVLVDRGSIDSKFYGYKFLQEGVCSKEQYEAFNKTFVERLKPDCLLHWLFHQRFQLYEEVAKVGW